ncbi:hypothetical protein DFJ74DRAFT_402439 [Hyaloraphidium curvatum]|nr:hypothetical protein DFJ74DRAFT_402439 [Hyaloraphidium curvatum]
MKPGFTPVTGGGGTDRGRQQRPQIAVPAMAAPAASAGGTHAATPTGPPSPAPASPLATPENPFPPIRPRSASLSRASVPVDPSRPKSPAGEAPPPSRSPPPSPSLTLSRDPSSPPEPLVLPPIDGSDAPVIIDVPPPRAPSPDIAPPPSPKLQPQSISFAAPSGSSNPQAAGTAPSTSTAAPKPAPAPAVQQPVPRSLAQPLPGQGKPMIPHSMTSGVATGAKPAQPAASGQQPVSPSTEAPVPSYKQPIPTPQPVRSPTGSSSSLSVPGATRPRGGRRGSGNGNGAGAIALIPPTADPPGKPPRYAILDYSAEAGAGQYQVGTTSASLEAYLADAASHGVGVGKGGGGRVGDSQQTARWAHLSYSAREPRSEWAAIARQIKALGSFRGGGKKAGIGGRTYQKQTLTIDEAGVGFSIPVYAEDLSFGDAVVEGISPRAPGSWDESFGSAYSVVRAESTVLEALARVEGRALKRGRMEFRIEFVRGWRVDDIRMLLLTVLSLRDGEIENDLFGDPLRGIMPTANLYTDGTALLGAVLRSVVEIMAEVVSFLEDSFADAEAVVFMKPAVLYQQVLTALKAEMLVVKRDLSVAENQIRALAGFLVGVAPPGSAWAGSAINVEAVANECVVLRERTDALLQRCDALVGLVNFEVSAFQNRIIFALTAVSMLFAPAGIYAEVIKTSEEMVIGDGTPLTWWLGLMLLFAITGFILLLWVGPTVIRDGFEELSEWDRDALTRSRRIFFKRLAALVAERRRIEAEEAEIERERALSDPKEELEPGDEGGQPTLTG